MLSHKAFSFLLTPLAAISLLSAQELQTEKPLEKNNGTHVDSSKGYNYKNQAGYPLEIFPIEGKTDPQEFQEEKDLPLFEKERLSLPNPSEMQMQYEPGLDPNFADDGHILQDDQLLQPDGSLYNCAINNVYGVKSACGPAYLIYGYHIDRKKDSADVRANERNIYNLYIVIENKNTQPKIDIDVWDFNLPYHVIIGKDGKDEYTKEADKVPNIYNIYYASGVEFIENGDTIDHIFHLTGDKPTVLTPEEAQKLKELHDKKQKHLEDDKNKNQPVANDCQGPVNIYHIYEVSPPGQKESLNLIDQYDTKRNKDQTDHIYHLDKRMHGFLFDPSHVLSDQELLNMINKFFYIYSLNCSPSGYGDGGEGGGEGGEGSGGEGGYGSGGVGTGFSFGSSSGGGGSGGSNGSGSNGTTTGTATATTTGTATTATGGRVTDTTTTSTGVISVPEPSTYLILGAGLTIIVYMRYRRRKTIK